MAKQVKWTELTPSIWGGSVDGEVVYTVFELEPRSPEYAGAFVKRRGVRDEFRMTNVGRAKDIAELQQERVHLLLQKRGLLLPAR